MTATIMLTIVVMVVRIHMKTVTSKVVDKATMKLIEISIASNGLMNGNVKAGIVRMKKNMYARQKSVLVN